MHRHTNRAGLVGHGAGDRLTDPPGGIGGELEAFLPIEFLDGANETQIAFLDKVEE